jgi:hypothetical protein
LDGKRCAKRAAAGKFSVSIATRSWRIIALLQIERPPMPVSTDELVAFLTKLRQGVLLHPCAAGPVR